MKRERTSFVGRDEELAALERQLRDGAPLVSIVGPGGAGKTRLATQLVRRHAAERSDALSFFADAVTARDAAGLVSVVAETLGAWVQPSSGFDARVELVGRVVLHRAPLLVVLDNLEQVTDGAGAVLERWIDLAPATQWVVTSRRALEIEGEHRLSLGPLPLPSPDDPRPGDSAAVQLFTARAESAGATLERTDETLRLAGEIVRVLGGLPLAIELCAARAPMLGLAGVLEAIRRRHSFADTTKKVERHRTIEATVGWSWDLLEPSLQRALVELGVFVGAFDPDAVEAVARVSDGRVIAEQLAAASLLQPTDTGGFRLYESVRQFIEPRLDGPDLARACERHARFFVDRFDDLLTMRVDREVLADEVALRAAMWELVEIARRAGAGVVPWSDGARALFLLRGQAGVLAGSAKLPELVAAALEATVGDAPSRALLLFTRAGLSVARTENAAAIADYEAAYEIAARSTPALAGACALRLVRRYLEVLDVPAARGALARASTATAPLRDPTFEAWVAEAGCVIAWMESDAATMFEQANQGLACLGDADVRMRLRLELVRATAQGAGGDHHRAAIAMADILERGREQLSTATTCVSLINAGDFARTAGDLDRARELLDRSVELARAHGYLNFETSALAHRAKLLLELGELEAARADLTRTVAPASTLARIAVGIPLAVAEHRLGASRRALAILDELRGLSDFPASDLGGPVLDAFQATFELAGADDGEAQLAVAHERLARLKRLDGRRTGPIDLEWAIGAIEAELGARSSGARLRIEADGRWFELVGSTRVALGGRRKLARLLMALARAREDAPGSYLSQDALFEAAWPGERATPTSARHRVHVALSELRNLGLAPLLERDESGYRLAPLAKVEIAR